MTPSPRIVPCAAMCHYGRRLRRGARHERQARDDSICRLFGRKRHGEGSSGRNPPLRRRARLACRKARTRELFAENTVRSPCAATAGRMRRGMLVCRDRLAPGPFRIRPGRLLQPTEPHGMAECARCRLRRGRRGANGLQGAVRRASAVVCRALLLAPGALGARAHRRLPRMLPQGRIQLPGLLLQGRRLPRIARVDRQPRPVGRRSPAALRRFRRQRLLRARSRESPCGRGAHLPAFGDARRRRWH